MNRSDVKRGRDSGEGVNDNKRYVREKKVFTRKKGEKKTDRDGTRPIVEERSNLAMKDAEIEGTGEGSDDA